MISKLSCDKCCICRGCVDACPVNAIWLNYYIDGFYYPTIDTEKCVGCDCCEKVCPQIENEVELPKGFPLVYAAKSTRDKVRKQSSSGGIFYELAEHTINKDGYICGAVFDEEFRVKHIVTNDMAEVAKMCGSKYVQSDTSGVYRQIEKILNEGKCVLFCGCPCQCAALKKFLGKTYENLALVDLICHGVPSQAMFDSYRELLEKRYKSQVSSIQFRNKEYGWHSFSVRIEFQNGKIYSERYTMDSYMRAFLQSAIMKPSCYSCIFKEFKSGSDITLGDFWGAEIVCPEYDDNLGLSVVFINSAVGQGLLEDLGNIEIMPAVKEAVVAYNGNVVEPSKPNDIRNDLLTYAKGSGYGEAIEHFFRVKTLNKWKQKLKYRLKCIYFSLLGKDKPLY